jgi:outer membrane protein OmpA-like peptidoglycan-associated protein
MFFAGNSSLYAQEQPEQQQGQYKHWSVSLKGGANRNESIGKLLNTKGFGGQFGIELERTFNPLWGLSASYTYLTYGDPVTKNGTSSEVTGIAHLNLLNLVDKYRRDCWQKWNVYGYIGGGLAFFHKMSAKGTTVSLPVGASVEYNVSPQLALALIGDRRWHSSNMGTPNGKLSVWTASVGLRLKFGNTRHVKNVALTDYEAVYLRSATQAYMAYEDANLKKELETNAGNIRRLQDELNQTKDQLNRTNEALNKTNSELEQLKNAGPAQKQGEKKQNPEAYWNGPASSVTQFSDNIWAFPIGRAEVSSVPEEILNVLKTQPETKIILVGHTDNSGPEALNEGLSLERAEAVKNLLIQHGIDAQRITTKGEGSSKPVASNDDAAGRRKNRRVDFILVTP